MAVLLADRLRELARRCVPTSYRSAAQAGRVARQAITPATISIAAASQKVPPAQPLCRSRPVTSAKARVNTVGPKMPARLDKLTMAPCRRPGRRHLLAG